MMDVTEKTGFTWIKAPDCPDGLSLDAAGSPTGRPLVAGSVPVEMTAEELAGLWSLRFGMFGCADRETRGGVIHIGEGMLVGGDSTFAYLGRWSFSGIELRATLDIARHSRNDAMASIFGSREDVYHACCIAHAITPNLFEGRIQRPGYADARLTMRRMAGR
ncbi:hypothetical protein [Sphingomonas sp. Root720]|uniref:hypothetical protein n=1 Tax=Sphingomonas sp. Root720 TaxID=1736595 RepID=UPI0006FC1351|nr:hypothetical protein [Sphingomonas sp. Root720]